MIRNDVPAENYSYDVKTVRTYSKQNLQLSKIKSTYAKTKKKGSDIPNFKFGQ